MDQRQPETDRDRREAFGSSPIGRTHDDDNKHEGQNDFRQRPGRQRIASR